MTRLLAVGLSVLLAACAPKGAPVGSMGRPLPRTSSAAPVQEVREATKAFQAATGVRLHVYGLPGDGAPGVTRGVAEGPVDLALVPPAVPVLQEVVQAYPEQARLRLVPDLWIVGRLRANGHPFLGMARPRLKRLDVALRPRTGAEQLASTLHHEIAHLVMATPGFDRSTWRSFSAGRYVGMRPNTKWPTEGRPWLGAGFVSPYASKNPSEDFATLVEMGFGRPQQLKRLVDEHEVLRRKLAFVTGVYDRVVPGVRLPWRDAAD